MPYFFCSQKISGYYTCGKNIIHGNVLFGYNLEINLKKDKLGTLWQYIYSVKIYRKIHDNI